MVIPVLSPTGHRLVIINENVGKGVRQRDEETTMDGEGESELTELSIMPKVWRAEKKAPSRKQGVPKNTTVVVLSEPRSKPCDWCKAQNRQCLPRSKGGEPLEACKGCYT